MKLVIIEPLGVDKRAVINFNNVKQWMEGHPVNVMSE